MFIAITCWWLTQDRGVPIYDAGTHLFTALASYKLLRAGDFAALRDSTGYYPPTTFLVGAVAMLVAGTYRWVPVVAENLVYVPLVALGCFRTGRLAAGSRAGCLAAVFALGSPLLIEQFHVFMIDAPLAALVAVSVWLILESQRFQRVGVSAAAGLAAGVGLASKEQFPLYVAGLLAVVLARERGWRNWRGLASFTVVAFAIGSPWYLANLSELGHFASAGLGNATVLPEARPPLGSLANVDWYLWATLNALLFAPLFAFAAVGVAHATISSLRARRRRAPDAGLNDHAPELLAGLLFAYLALTATPHHDLRYTMPLVVYLSVLGTAWIVALPRRTGSLAVALLGCAVIATTLGATFGLGREIRIVLPGGPVETNRVFGTPPLRQITLYADRDFLVSGPRRGVDVGGLIEALRDHGITGLYWSRNAFLGDPVFDGQGLAALARLAGMDTPQDLARWDFHDPRHALLVRYALGRTPPCVDLRDGTGVVVQIPDPATGRATTYCPFSHQRH